MRITKPGLMSSVYGLFTPGAGTPVRREDRTEEIRLCMLDCLGATGAARFPAVARRVRWAGDACVLWYLRSTLMAALCELHGELAARRQMATISNLFEGMLPAGLASRPSPLEH
ncbi:MAG: hypothetical protein ABIR26_18840 [Ramlibacter sp.]